MTPHISKTNGCVCVLALWRCCAALCSVNFDRWQSSWSW